MRNKALKKGLALILVFTMLIGQSNLLDAGAAESEITVESAEELDTSAARSETTGATERESDVGTTESETTVGFEEDTASEDEEEEPADSEDTEEESMETEEEVSYDSQPTTIEEVQAAIDTYREEYAAVLIDTEDYEEAAKVQKPHWQYMVPADIIPAGYYCDLVEDDENFNAPYYTFFVGAAVMTSTWDGTSIATGFLVGDGTSEATAYEISAAAELAYLAKQVNDGVNYEGVYFKLTDDINLNNKAWTSIGTVLGGRILLDSTSSTLMDSFNNDKRPFKGIFDGQNNTISGISISSPNTSSYYKGLFGCVENATIKNLAVQGSVSGSGYTGMLVGVALDNTTIFNCTAVAGSVTTNYGSATGGLIGCMASITSGTTGTITDCSTKNITVKTTGTYGHYAGGLVGCVYFLYDRLTDAHKSLYVSDSTIRIEGCTVLGGSVSVSGLYSSEVGGLVGGSYSGGGDNNAFEVINSKSSSSVTLPSMTFNDSAGGLIGSYNDRYATNTTFKVLGCNATGKVLTQGIYGNYAGGLIGRIQLYEGSGRTVEIADCTASGEVEIKGSDTSSIGGLIGQNYLYIAKDTTITISRSSADGDVSMAGSLYGTGGLIGNNYLHVSENTTIKVSDCSTAGLVTSTNINAYGVGGMIGYNFVYNSKDTEMEVSNCSTTGDVITTGGNTYGVGGLIGYNLHSISNDTTLTVSDCWTSGNVSILGASSYGAGGLIGYNLVSASNRTTIAVSNSFHKDGVIKASSVAGGNNMGGLIGMTLLTGFDHNFDIIDCYSTGNVVVEATGTGGIHIGGLIGWLSVSDSASTDPVNKATNNIANISGCHSSGTVSVTSRGGANNIGGLIGFAINYGEENKLAISGNYATGAVVADDGVGGGLQVGGFIGYSAGGGAKNTVEISDNYATGDVSSKSATTGALWVSGFIGYSYLVGDDNVFSISNCYATGNVITDSGTTGGNGAGGFAGHNYIAGANNEYSITNCSASGSVTSNSRLTGAKYTGGFLAYIDMSSTDGKLTISGCDASGSVTSNAQSAGGAERAGGFIGSSYVIAHRNMLTVLECSASGNVTSNGAGTGGESIGGFWGYNYFVPASTGTLLISNCHATGHVTSIGGRVGGFLGYHYVMGTNRSLSSKILDCYATGEVSSTSYFGTGGLIGHVYSNAFNNTVENCYATGNVKSTHSSNTNSDTTGTGGLIGVASNISIINSYAIGSATANKNSVGGLIGILRRDAGDRDNITNCYATGTTVVYGTTANSDVVGGFVGTIASVATTSLYAFSNCFFDTTTTGVSNSIGRNASSNTTVSNITGKLTEEMIKIDTYPAPWNMKSNFGGLSAGTADDDNPWYIDDNVTYPYLYYQYDGRSAQETNYNLKSVTYTDDTGALAYVVDRTDFYYPYTGTFGYDVISAGAVEAYFPYNQHKDPINQTSATFVTSADNWSLYSLGSISASDIVAFVNGPSATKSSDREDLDGDGITDTYIGDIITYTITARNIEKVPDGDERDHTWYNIQIKDPLPTGLTLVPDSVELDGVSVPEGSGGSPVPYYTYDEASRTLVVYIGDIQVGESAVVTFQALVGDEAATNPDKDNIRNKGVATGEYLDETFNAGFDDYNKDPVLKSKFTVTYDKNDGDDPSTSGTVPVDGNGYYGGSTVVVLGNTGDLDRTNYRFVEWNTEADGTGMGYLADDEFIITANTTLYAQWESTLASLRFNKMSDGADGSTPIALRNANFSLYKWVGEGSSLEANALVPANISGTNWQFVKEKITTATGLAEFENLDAGIYQLVETVAPYGYELPSGQWRFTVAANSVTGLHEIGTITTIAGSDGEIPPSLTVAPYTPESGDYTLPNTKSLSFSFTKVKAEDITSPLNGAEFMLYMWNGTGTIKDVVENDTITSGEWELVDQDAGVSQFVFNGLVEGVVYQLVETVAPEGYSRPVGQWRLVADASGDWTITGMGSILPPAFAVDEETGELSLPNMKDKFFPLTGFGGIASYLIIGMAVMAVASVGIVFLLSSKKRKIEINKLLLREQVKGGTE